MRAVQIERFGGPEVLGLTDLPSPRPGPGQVLIEVEAAGVNYADTHQSENSYLTPQRLPLVPGAEVVGRVVDVGTADPGSVPLGQRVVAVLPRAGGYAEQALAPQATCVPIPDDLDAVTALALIVQGSTAWYLLRSCTRLRPGESVVVHAAAGGVGTLAVQLARQWGAGRVIATASSPDKLTLADELGAHALVDITASPDSAAVRDALLAANHGREVDVILEMAGGHVFDGSLAALAPMGRLAVYGLASRVPPTPIDPVALMARSRTVIGFWLVHALADPNGLVTAMTELLSLVRAGRLRAICGGRYRLEQASQAHQDLLARRTSGKLILEVAR